MEEESKQVLELAKHSWLIGFFFFEPPAARSRSGTWAICGHVQARSDRKKECRETQGRGKEKGKARTGSFVCV